MTKWTELLMKIVPDNKSLPNKMHFPYYKIKNNLLMDVFLILRMYPPKNVPIYNIQCMPFLAGDLLLVVNSVKDKITST